MNAILSLRGGLSETLTPIMVEFVQGDEHLYHNNSLINQTTKGIEQMRPRHLFLGSL